LEHPRKSSTDSGAQKSKNKKKKHQATNFDNRSHRAVTIFRFEALSCWQQEGAFPTQRSLLCPKTTKNKMHVSLKPL